MDTDRRMSLPTTVDIISKNEMFNMRNRELLIIIQWVMKKTSNP